MMKAVVSGIEWETDGEDVQLPVDVTIDVLEDMNDDEIVNEISDEYGYLIKGMVSIKRERN